MFTLAPSLTQLSDSDLVAEVARLASKERDATADLIASLAELDARRLYLPEGFPSLFAYCTERLHFSEHAAYHRIEAARAARLFPVVLEDLRDGSLTLTAVAMLRSHLTAENHHEVLEAARHKSKRAIEELAARLHPRPDTATLVRKLPEPRASAPERGCPGVSLQAPGGLPLWERERSDTASASDAARSAASPPTPSSQRFGFLAPTNSVPEPRRAATLRPLAPARYHLQMTVSAETHAKLLRARDLLRHQIPDGDAAAIVDRALSLLVQHLEHTKFAAKKARGGQARITAKAVPTVTISGGARATSAAPAATAKDVMPHNTAGCQKQNPDGPAHPGRRHRSRHIPAEVRRAVWQRDGGQCAFVGTAGRCPERGFLEYHHRIPFADGGATTVENMCLACRAHNAWEAQRWQSVPLASRATECGSSEGAAAPSSGTRSGPS